MAKNCAIRNHGITKGLTIYFEGRSLGDSLRFRGRVSESILTSRKSYDYFGVELRTGEDLNWESEPEYDPSFNPKYNQGDIVVFKELACLTIRTLKETIAVVTRVPLTFEERTFRKMRTEDLDYTDQTYMLEHITESGKLEHSHILEEDLVLYDNPIPEELKVLEHLALHFKGTKPIDEEILLSMMKGEVYMLNGKNWWEVLS